MFIKYILSTLALLTLFCANSAHAVSNSILNTSIRQTSSDGINVTFFTKSESSETPIVKNKGNNQYVILLPNTSDATGRMPDLRNVSNLVSDVNVKTINEGAVTYTKVTLTTKKPVNVNANTKRTSQSASELSGVNDIVAKVNLISQDIQASKNIAPQSVAYQAQNVQPMPKLNSVQDILNNKNIIGTQRPKPVQPKVEQKVEPKPVPTLAPAPKNNTVSAHVPADLKTVKKETSKLKNENIKNVRNEAVKNIDKIEKNIKSSVVNNVSINEEEQLDAVETPISLEPIQEDSPIPEVLPEENRMDLSKIIASPLLLISLLVFGGLLLAILLFNKVRATLSASDDITTSFIERMNSSIPSSKRDFSGIASNQNMNWQQKYASFKQGKTEEQQEEIRAHIGAEHDEDLDVVEEADDYALQNYAEPVEEEVEVLPLMKDTPNPFATAFEGAHGSGDVISRSMKRSLKAFEGGRSLTQTRRNSGIKGRFRSFETTPIEGLNRNMSALLDTVIQMDEEKGISSSVEQPIEVTPQEFVQHVQEKMEVKNNATSPIQKAQAPAPRRKMKIKESRAIDENRGFYLVDMDDKLALMGRINDKFTVLKKFDDKEKTTLQVRRDKDSLYMVRTDGFKALVDVKEDKMGVLAEL